MWAVHLAIREFCNSERLLGGEVVTFRTNSKVIAPIQLDINLGDVSGPEYLSDEEEGYDLIGIRVVLNTDLDSSKSDYHYFSWVFLDYLKRLHQYLREVGFFVTGFAFEQGVVQNLEFEASIFFNVNMTKGLGNFCVSADGSDLKGG